MKKPVTRVRFRKALPQAIVLLREARKLSQAELARKLEISPATMCRYEKGDYKPGVIRLAHILEVLRADFSDLDAALRQVWSAEEEGGEPSPEVLLHDEDADHAQLMAAYATAAAHGEGDQFVERVIRQAQALSRMRRHMEQYEKSWRARYEPEKPKAKAAAGDEGTVDEAEDAELQEVEAASE